MKKVIVKKLLTSALAICLTFTSAYAFAPMATITAQAAGDITNPTPMQPSSNTDFSGPWNDLGKKAHDCYKVTLPEDGAFTVTLMAQNSSDMVCCIRSSQSLDHSSELENTSVYCEHSNSPYTNTVSTVLSAGTYFITVENRLSPGNGQYKLKTIYESFGVAETPDSYDSPKSLSVNNTYTDAITKTDSEDWYKVTILENRKYSLKVSSVQNTVSFTLKNTDLQTVSRTDCYKNSTKSESIFLKAGVYYLQVNGWPSKYTFSLDNAKINQSSITKLKAVNGKKVDITFKNATSVAGYQIRYSTDKSFKKNVKTTTIKLNKTRTVSGNKRMYTASKLKKNKKYFFQIRSYVDNQNTRYYSDWSKSKGIKVK